MNHKKKAPVCANRPEAQIILSNDCNDDPVTNIVKPLPRRFYKGNFQFEQIARNGIWVVYKKRRPIWPEDSWTFELIKVRTRPAEVSFGRSYPPREVYPCSEDWGERGFACQGEEEALKRLHEMTEEPYMLVN